MHRLTRNLQVVAALLDAGAHANAKTTEGATPLSLARAGGRTEAVAELEKRGATE